MYMTVFVRICFSMLLAFSLLSSVKAASFDLPFVHEVKEGKKPAMIELKKPNQMTAMDWLIRLEEERDAVELEQDYKTFRAITQEISATLAGKYGIGTRSANNEERQRMIASITRTRNHFIGIPDILSQLYFSYNPTNCWRKLKQDPTYAQHMGAILAVDTICYANRQQLDFAEDFAEEKESKAAAASPKFIKTVINIAVDIAADSYEDKRQETLRKAMQTLSSSLWKTLIKDTGWQLDITAPVINDIFTDLVGGDNYQGWQPHRIDFLGSWIRKEGKSLLENLPGGTTLIQNSEKVIVQPLWYQGILLDSSLLFDPFLKSNFKGLGHEYFNGQYLGIPYSFFAPNKTEKLFAPIRFYLTKAISREEKERVLTLQKRKKFDSSKFDLNKQENLWFETRTKIQKAFAIKESLFEGLLQEASKNLAFDPTPIMSFRSLVEVAAAQGDKIAQSLYAWSYWFYKEVMSIDLGEARHYFKMAADQGHLESQLNYALMLKKGEGGPILLNEAFKYCKMATHQGLESAKKLLSTITVQLKGEALVVLDHRSLPTSMPTITYASQPKNWWQEEAEFTRHLDPQTILGLLELS